MIDIKFGTDGWRGRIARDFTFENVERVIQAFCDIFTASPVPQKVFLGYDRRFLSREFAECAAQVLTANQIEVHLARQFCPTPCVSWMVKSFDAGAGVMITASHNPFEWNGIKFKEPGGFAASPQYTDPIEARVVENMSNDRTPQRIPLSEAKQKGLLHEFDPLGPYVEQLRRMVDVEAIQAAAWNIVFDPMYGAGAGYLHAVLGDGIKEIHGDANPSFARVQPEPLAKNLPELMGLVSEEGIDVGLATDGDADRIGAVDEQGHFVDSHHIFALILQHLIEKRDGQGDIVKTLSTTQMIDRLGEHYGRKVHLSPIGFKYLCDTFRKVPCLIGGEESGGIAVVDHIPERDGTLCALFLLEIMSQNKKPLGRLIHDLEETVGTHRFQRNDLTIPDDVMVRLRMELKDFKCDELAGVAVTNIVRMDGCRLELKDGTWVLIRPSGTEPLLRLYAEASSEERAATLLAAVEKVLPL